MKLTPESASSWMAFRPLGAFPSAGGGRLTLIGKKRFPFMTKILSESMVISPPLAARAKKSARNENNFDIIFSLSTISKLINVNFIRREPILEAAVLNFNLARGFKKQRPAGQRCRQSAE